MKQLSGSLRITSLFSTLVLVTLLLLSCQKKVDLIPKSDLLNLPSQSVMDFQTIYTDSGKLQVIMSSSLMEKYDKIDPPYIEFKKGIKVIFYDGQKEPVASVTSKYARYNDNDVLWELKDSVVVINVDNDKLETEILYWDQQKDLIYTDRFVKITSVDQIVMGTGFESDPKLVKRRIKKVSATIYLRDEE